MNTFARINYSFVTHTCNLDNKALVLHSTEMQKVHPIHLHLNITSGLRFEKFYKYVHAYHSIPG